MLPNEKKFEQAMQFMTPRIAKWEGELIDSINKLDLSEEGKDAILIWSLELLLFQTPYPNRIVINTLAAIISHISSESSLGDLSWKKRDAIFRRKKIY